jgi:hypothetical protein
MRFSDRHPLGGWWRSAMFPPAKAIKGTPSRTDVQYVSRTVSGMLQPERPPSWCLPRWSATVNVTRLAQPTVVCCQATNGGILRGRPLGPKDPFSHRPGCTSEKGSFDYAQDAIPRGNGDSGSIAVVGHSTMTGLQGGNPLTNPRWAPPSGVVIYSGWLPASTPTLNGLVTPS